MKMDIGREERESTAEAAGANSLMSGLDDKAIESKIGELVREGAQ